MSSSIFALHDLFHEYLFHFGTEPRWIEGRNNYREIRNYYQHTAPKLPEELQAMNSMLLFQTLHERPSHLSFSVNSAIQLVGFVMDRLRHLNEWEDIPENQLQLWKTEWLLAAIYWRSVWGQFQSPVSFEYATAQLGLFKKRIHFFQNSSNYVEYHTRLTEIIQQCTSSIVFCYDWIEKHGESALNALFTGQWSEENRMVEAVVLMGIFELPEAKEWLRTLPPLPEDAPDSLPFPSIDRLRSTQATDWSFNHLLRLIFQ